MNDLFLYKNDPAMLYEIILRRVYHCGRGEDPFGLANADFYFFNEDGKLDADTIVGLWTALYLLKHQVNNDSCKSTVKRIKYLLEEYPTNKTFLRLSKEIFRILDLNQISEFPHQISLRYNQ